MRSHTLSVAVAVEGVLIEESIGVSGGSVAVAEQQLYDQQGEVVT